MVSRKNSQFHLHIEKENGLKVSNLVSVCFNEMEVKLIIIVRDQIWMNGEVLHKPKPGIMYMWQGISGVMSLFFLLAALANVSRTK